ncbi:MAG: sigma-70 family RNA polymerase sigma factor [Crocinitomicaceae bacterium]
MKATEEIMTETDEIQIEWSLFVNGNNTYISGIYKRYLPQLIFVAYAYLEDEEKSKDVVGDVFESLISMSISERKLKLSGVNQKLSPFLKVIVKNRCLNIRRIEQNRKRILLDFSALFVKKSASFTLDKNDYQKLMQLLPDRQREIFTLHNQGYNNHEIGQKLSISINTVKNTLVNSKKKLRELYNTLMT